jgi:hypothetical protein
MMHATCETGWDVITALLPSNENILLQKPPIFSVYREIKNGGYIKPSTAIGRNGDCKPRLVRDSSI